MIKMVKKIQDKVTVDETKFVIDKNHKGTIKTETSEKSYCFEDNCNKRVLNYIDENHVGTFPFGY